MSPLDAEIIIATSPHGVPVLKTNQMPVYHVLETLMSCNKEEVQEKLKISEDQLIASLAYASGQMRSMALSY